MYKFTPTEIVFESNVELIDSNIEGFHNPFSSTLITQTSVWEHFNEQGRFISFELTEPVGDVLVGRGRDGDAIVLFIKDESYCYAIIYASRYGDFSVIRATEEHLNILRQHVNMYCKRFDFLDEIQRVWPANILPNGHYDTKTIEAFNHLRNTMQEALKTICSDNLRMSMSDGWYKVPAKLGSVTLPSDS